MPSNRVQSLSKSIWLSPAFLLGLAFKILFSFLFASEYMTRLFVPFINWFVISGFKNPWDFFYQAGMLRMFPYPPLMLWIMALPRLLFSPVLPADWEIVTPLHLFIARIPLIVFDVFLFYLLTLMFPVHRKKVVAIYWFSPIVFFINYVHGQLDIIPTAVFFGAVLLLINRRYAHAMIVLALGTATKSHLFIALPFILVFLYKQKVGFLRLAAYLGLFGLVYAPWVIPAAASEAFQAMVYHSPEQNKLFAFAVSLSPSFTLVICPMVIFLVFFKFASYKKLNREILLMFLGIVFACLVVFVPPMPGWFLWSLPFLIYFYISNRDFSRAPFIFYNAVYLVYFLFFFERRPPGIGFLNMEPELVNSMALSLIMASVAFIALWMFRLGIKKNEELRIKEEPLLIGIGGDSSSGKHTLYRALRILAGKDKSIPIFGDNFHKWERGNEMWKVYTHLHPSGSQLHKGVETTIALKEGEPIEMGQYDHATGKFSKASVLEPNKFIFFIGLHPFYLKKMRELIKIKIFLDTEEGLRRYWKIRRDVAKRGHTPAAVLEQIEAREPDSEKYIKPQAQFADLIIRIEPVKKIEPETPAGRNLPLKVKYTLDNSVNLEALIEGLKAVKTLEIQHSQDVVTQELEARGAVTAREVMKIAYGLGLNFDELLIRSNKWLKNYHGITQLIFLLIYNDKMEAR